MEVENALELVTENMEFVNITSGHVESVLAYKITQHLKTRAALVIPKSISIVNN